MRRATPGPLPLLLACCCILAAPAWTGAEDPPPEEAPQPPPAPGQSAAPSPGERAQPLSVVVTLGDFAVRVASELELPGPADGFVPESAAWALLQKGIRLRSDLSSPLTEADTVAILNALGFSVRTSTPNRVVTRDRAEALLSVFFPSPS
ncbi:MAG TPA: hypothetical protein VJV23_04720 [Candidatus Polarisedimenticolia bacterium]|nr:hypothetical protein [Candidatus Polarisedimenticolia bacterium]